MLEAHYVLPIRWTDDDAARLDELTGYLGALARVLPVLVVDGSPPARFARHARRWSGLVEHVPPEPWPGRNGKVAGVMTGVRRATSPVVVVADDDVRWRPEQLARALALLDGAALVRPQNYFDPLPWHAAWDTGRTLLNRALASDYPGTLVLRRSALLDAGGYDGDVLFENLELIRTVCRNGGREVRADDLYVRRLPPTARHFLGQRVRQAYDSLAQPARLAAELALAPLAVAATRRPRLAAALVLGVLALAEGGRRRAGGAAVFPPRTTAWAPVWVIERAVCSWVALGYRARGGIPYAGARLLRAASPSRGALSRRPRPRS
jgi:hypothetical protein